MYNENIKWLYIDEKSQEVVLPNHYLTCLFGKTERYEEMLNKDVSNWTTYEIIDFLKVLNVGTLESLIVMNSQLSMYTQWCLQHNLVEDCQNHFLEIDKDKLKGCLNLIVFGKKIISRKTLLSLLDSIPNPRDEFILLCLFEGIKGKDFCEIFKLKLEDIEGNKAKLCTGREVYVSDRLIEIAHESNGATVYYSISDKQSKKMPLKDIGNIIRGYPNQNPDASTFQCGRVCYNSCTRSLAFLGLGDYMSANSLNESGKISFILNRSKELGITPKEYIYSDNIKEVEAQFDYKIIKANFFSKYEEYLA